MRLAGSAAQILSPFRLPNPAALFTRFISRLRTNTKQPSHERLQGCWHIPIPVLKQENFPANPKILVQRVCSYVKLASAATRLRLCLVRARQHGADCQNKLRHISAAVAILASFTPLIGKTKKERNSRNSGLASTLEKHQDVFVSIFRETRRKSWRREKPTGQSASKSCDQCWGREHQELA